MAHIGDCKWGYSLFDRKRLEPKKLLWQQHKGGLFVSFLMHICGAKFQERCFNISRDIVYCSGIMVSAPVSILSSTDLGLSPVWGHCVLFLGKALYSHSADLSTQVYKCVPVNLMFGGNPAMD